MSNEQKRHEPEVRISPDGKKAIVEGIDRYSREAFVREVAGDRPEGFENLVRQATEIARKACEACGYEWDDQDNAHKMHVRDALLLAAWAITDSANKGNGQNPVAFVQAAKQAIDWCKPQLEGRTELEIMEARNRELARLLAERVWRNEGFLVVLFDQGPPGGQLNWITSIDRRQTISILSEALQGIREDQARRS